VEDSEISNTKPPEGLFTFLGGFSILLLKKEMISRVTEIVAEIEARPIPMKG
jgi:hypothetical protein